MGQGRRPEVQTPPTSKSVPCSGEEGSHESLPDIRAALRRCQVLFLTQMKTIQGPHESHESLTWLISVNKNYQGFRIVDETFLR